MSVDILGTRAGALLKSILTVLSVAKLLLRIIFSYSVRQALTLEELVSIWIWEGYFQYRDCIRYDSFIKHVQNGVCKSILLHHGLHVISRFSPRTAVDMHQAKPEPTDAMWCEKLMQTIIPSVSVKCDVRIVTTWVRPVFKWHASEGVKTTFNVSLHLPSLALLHS